MNPNVASQSYLHEASQQLPEADRRLMDLWLIPEHAESRVSRASCVWKLQKRF